MASYTCQSCGFSREVPEKLAGKKAKCPRCGAIGVAGQAVPATVPAPATMPEVSPRPGSEPVAAPEAAPPADAGQAPAPPPAAPQTVFLCKDCGFRKDVPAKLAGKTAACPSCGKPVRIGGDLAAKAPAAEERLDVEAIVETVAAETPPELEPETETPPAQAATLADPGHPRAEAGRFLQGRFLENVFAGIVSGALLFLFCTSFAVLVLPQPLLADHLGCALSIALIGAVIVGGMYAVASALPFTLAGPEPMLCGALSLLVGSLYAHMAGHFPAQTVLTTIFAAVAIASLAIGACVYLLGKLKAGGSIRYLPFHILGGVVAGVGWFILRRAFDYMAGVDISLQTLFKAPGLAAFTGQISGGAYLLWLPGLCLGLILLAALCRTSNPLYMLLVLAVPIGLAEALPSFQELAPIAGSLAGLSPGMGPGLERFLEIYTPGFLAHIHWASIIDHQMYIGVLPVLVAITAMFKTTSLEMLHGKEVDMDVELKSLGRANILAGLCGGLPGTLSQGRSLGARAVGAKGPVAGLVAALSAALCLAYSEALLPHIPKLVPAGLLVYFGLALMKRWLVGARNEFSRTEDYLLLVVTFLATVGLGFVLGVGVGLAASLLITVNRSRETESVKHRLSGAFHRSNVDRAPVQSRTLNEKGGKIFILKLQGFLFLGAMHGLLKDIEERLDDWEAPPLKFVVLDFASVSGLDSAIGIGFNKLRELSLARGFNLVFTSVPFDLEEHLARSGYTVGETPGSFQVFLNLDYGLEWCENKVLEAEGMLSLKQKALPELLAPSFPEPEQIPRLMRALEKVQVKRRQYVFRQGDRTDAMYFVESGTLEVEVDLEGGKVLRLKKVGPGAVFGEMGLYTNSTRSASILAMESCTLYRLSTERLKSLETKDPKLVAAINHYLVGLLAQRLAESNAKVRDLLK